MKVRDVLKRLNSEGWVIDRQKGSHQQFVHPEEEGACHRCGPAELGFAI